MSAILLHQRWLACMLVIQLLSYISLLMHVKGNHVCTFTWRPLNTMLHHGCYFRQNKITMLSKNVLARSRPVLDVLRLHAVPLKVAKQVAMVEARRYVADPDAKGIVDVSHDDGRLWAQIAADEKNQPLSLHEVLRCCWCQYYDELQIDTCTLRPSTLRVHKSKLLNHTTLFMALISFQNELNRCGLFLHQRHTL